MSIKIKVTLNPCSVCVINKIFALTPSRYKSPSNGRASIKQLLP